MALLGHMARAGRPGGRVALVLDGVSRRGRVRPQGHPRSDH